MVDPSHSNGQQRSTLTLLTLLECFNYTTSQSNLQQWLLHRDEGVELAQSVQLRSVGGGGSIPRAMVTKVYADTVDAA